ncbi:hypothetical protein HBH98_062580 [Parastagonospora nodorum]|nr:hypothetical protein HBH98_062580 [Parastagonospora nodorum]KAH4373528.1 hypothetical protein HBH99_226550 [Parastagonospora nodorum]KAH4379413.1 hypothetical protein HBH97_096340 [Parastagonospora nodorum]KAH4926694.1 hypothetical protein HBH74_110250 [Parastagonospora nodorum]KAH4942824.1 hypothetical protein HBH73_152620 [Parastagonospora nodorum]
MVKGELLTLGAAATAVGGAYKVGEFLFKAKRVRDVGPSNAVYVRIIGRVRSDLDEVRRLLSVREVHDALEANPEKSRWVYGAMRDVRGALENITPHTERVSGDVEAGRRIGVRHRVYWLLSEKEKLENREKELNFAHASLSEVLGYLTALEPVEEPKKPKEKESTKETHIDIDIHRDAPPPPQHQHTHAPPQHTHERVEREVYIERDAAPRRVERVEEHDVYFERDRQGPPRYEQHADIHIDEHGPHHQHVEADIHVQRGRDPRHLDHPQRYEAQYDDRYEQHDQYRSEYPEERHHESRPFPEPLGRRPEAYEDRLPERDSWMQSDARRARGQGQGNYGPYGEYAEYGAPQPVGAAHYQLPLSKEYKEREMWIEQKEDYRFDQYGNRLPDRFFQPPVPRPYRSRM